MHKFTLFTIGLSVVVILVVAEVVVNNYLGADFANEDQLIQGEVLDEVVAVEVVDSEARGDEDNSPQSVIPDGTVIPEAAVTPDTTPASDSIIPLSDEAAPGGITPELLTEIGVLEPRVETAAFQGLIFGLFDVKDTFSAFAVLEQTLLDGSNFIGTVYEISTENELQTFGAYETLRQKAQGSSLGTINENNDYGDASFYFNHSTKTSTVFLIVQKSGHVYALQYAPSYHRSVIKPLLEKL